jgi:hypothetical protein
MFYAVSKAMFNIAMQDWNFFGGHPFGVFFFYVSWFFWFFAALCVFLSWWVVVESYVKNEYNINLQNSLYEHCVKKIELLDKND